MLFKTQFRATISLECHGHLRQMANAFKEESNLGKITIFSKKVFKQ